MIRMQVNKVGFDSEGRAVIILSDEPGRQYMPIVIGQFEAHAIAFAEERPMKRPLTHDLMLSVIDELGYSMQKVEIVKLEDHIFHALLHLEDESGDHHAIDARPSDCIALLVRAEVPLYVDEDVLERAKWLSEEAEEEEHEKFRELMEDIDIKDQPPSDDTPDQDTPEGQEDA